MCQLIIKTSFVFLFFFLISCQKQIEVESSSYQPNPLIIDIPNKLNKCIS